MGPWRALRWGLVARDTNREIRGSNLPASALTSVEGRGAGSRVHSPTPSDLIYHVHMMGSGELPGGRTGGCEGAQHAWEAWKLSAPHPPPVPCSLHLSLGLPLSFGLFGRQGNVSEALP